MLAETSYAHKAAIDGHTGLPTHGASQYLTGCLSPLRGMFGLGIPEALHLERFVIYKRPQKYRTVKEDVKLLTWPTG